MTLVEEPKVEVQSDIEAVRALTRESQPTGAEEYKAALVSIRNAAKKGEWCVEFKGGGPSNYWPLSKYTVLKTVVDKAGFASEIIWPKEDSILHIRISWEPPVAAKKPVTAQKKPWWKFW